jgi:hypothetical protein
MEQIDVEPAAGRLLLAREKLQRRVTAIPAFMAAGATSLQQRFGLPRFLEVLTVRLHPFSSSSPRSALEHCRRLLLEQGLEVQICLNDTPGQIAWLYEHQLTAWIEVSPGGLSEPSVAVRLEFLEQGWGGFPQAAAERLRQIIRTPSTYMGWKEWFDAVWMLSLMGRATGVEPDEGLLTSNYLWPWRPYLFCKLQAVNMKRLQKTARVYAPARAGWVVDLMEREAIEGLLGPEARRWKRPALLERLR